MRPAVRVAACAAFWGALCLVSQLGAPASGGGLTATDLVMMDRVSGHRVSPDGEQVVFVRRRTDFDANRGRTDLWRVPVAGGVPVRLTRDPAGDHSPAWHPDGERIFFLSTRSGSSQVWRIDSSGGEAQQVTDLTLDVTNFVVSPSGARLALTLDAFPDCGAPACTRDRLAAIASSAESGQVYDSLFVRHWDTWKDGRRSQLFVISSEGEGLLPLTSGFSGDVPSRPFGGSEEIVFTPDGEGLVFSAREGGSSEAWSTDFDLYLVSVDGTGEPRLLTESNEAWDTHPVFSPDGSTLAYLAMERPGYESDRFRIVLRDWATGDERVLADDWDRSAGDLVFSADGRTIYVTAQDTGEVALFSIDVESGEATRLLAGGHVRSPALAAGGIVYGFDTLTRPVDLFWTDTEARRQRQLTRVNSRRLADIEMGETEQIRFAGWSGETVYAWIVKPAGFEADRTYPVAFIIHGGPQGSSDNDFHYRWNPQVYAGAGYAVVEVDFHGSTGYGQAFTDSINGDWGGKPLVDLQLGLAAALERFPWMDGSRACALGASYGGFMINWIAGNWPDGFRCLVNHDGVFDQRMMYYSTEELWFPEWDHGGPYWTNPQGFERHNPVDHVDRWRTPMLVVHGALDYRIPETHSLAAFTALQRQGIPSRLLRFPDENHWVLRPANSVQWHTEVLEWLDRWTGQ